MKKKKKKSQIWAVVMGGACCWIVMHTYVGKPGCAPHPIVPMPDSWMLATYGYTYGNR